MATLIVGSQKELDGIISSGKINEDKIDVILIKEGHKTTIKKGTFTE